MSNETIAYRLLERDTSGRLKTLFHGINGSRVIAIGRTYEAGHKMVVDGGGQKPYLAGFNVLLTEWEARYYQERFRAPRELVLAEVAVTGLRPKPRVRSPVWLAETMRVIRILED